jgi:hypothetical protein
MRRKTLIYVGILALAVLVLAIGGWIFRPFTHLRPRYA